LANYDNIQKAKNDWEEAIKIEINQDDYQKYDYYDEIYIDKGRAYLNLESYPEAINFFTEAIRINDKNTEAYRLRGLANYELELYKESINDFTKVVNARPKKNMDKNITAEAFNYRIKAYNYLSYCKIIRAHLCNLRHPILYSNVIIENIISNISFIESLMMLLGIAFLIIGIFIDLLNLIPEFKSFFGIIIGLGLGLIIDAIIAKYEIKSNEENVNKVILGEPSLLEKKY
jgi:tetratricopeptide (TPR) repeat protein